MFGSEKKSGEPSVAPELLMVRNILFRAVFFFNSFELVKDSHMQSEVIDWPELTVFGLMILVLWIRIKNSQIVGFMKNNPASDLIKSYCEWQLMQDASYKCEKCLIFRTKHCKCIHGVAVNS